MAIAEVSPGLSNFRQMAKKTIYRRLYGDEETVRCLECGDLIEYGRSDKKFCCGECKNMFHNRTRNVEAKLRLELAARLKVNYSVLSWLLWSGRRNSRIEEMSERGFDPAFFTARRKSGIHMEYECYDIEYYMSSNKVFNVHRIDYVSPVNGYLCKDKRH